jgi:hypothetical protein
MTRISDARRRHLTDTKCDFEPLVKFIENAPKEFERLSQIGTTQQFQVRSCTPVIAFKKSQVSSNFLLTFYYPKWIWLLLLTARQ